MGVQIDAGKAITEFKLDAFRVLACCMRFADAGYRPPTHENVDVFIKAMDWSQNDVAKLVGVAFDPVKGSITVRRWRLAPESRNSRAIPYAAWRLMLLAGGVVSRP